MRLVIVCLIGFSGYSLSETSFFSSPFSHLLTLLSPLTVWFGSEERIFLITTFNSSHLTPFFSSHISTNHLEACAALSAVCKVVNADMIPAIIKDVSYLSFLIFPHV